MKNYCPYETCSEKSDMFYSTTVNYNNSVVNKCMTCGQWSLYDVNTGGQIELPENLRNNDEWNQLIN